MNAPLNAPNHIIHHPVYFEATEKVVPQKIEFGVYATLGFAIFTPIIFGLYYAAMIVPSLVYHFWI